MKWILYKTTNKINRKYYIGIHETNKPYEFDGYIGNGIYISQPHTYENPTRAFQYAVKKYGPENFERETLEVYDDEDSAYKREAEIVTKEFILRRDVYNVKVGGSGGASFYRTVYQFDLEGNLVKTWATILDAANYFGVSDTAIRNKLEYRKSLNNFYFSLENTIDISKYSITKISTPCYKYSFSGKLVEEYDSIAECCEINNIQREKLRRLIALGEDSDDGYFYSFDLMEEYVKPDFENLVVYIYDLEGNFIQQTNNELERRKFFNLINKSTNELNKAISLNLKYKNHIFSLEYKDKIKPYKSPKAKIKVAQYTMEGELIKIFDTQKAACDIYGSGVRKVMQGKQKHCHNFIFKVYQEDNDIV